MLILHDEVPYLIGIKLVLESVLSNMFVYTNSVLFSVDICDTHIP
jgi:hypothetical protein